MSTPHFLDSIPARVRVLEVGPRDGLQNQKQIIPVATKAEWIARLERAGFEEIEATSFVNPKWIPQLADAAELVALLPQGSATLFSVLVPNLEGMDRAWVAGALSRFAIFTAASETFSHKNTNCSIAESLERFRDIFDRVRGDGSHVRAYISTSFGCPYEGDVPVARVVNLARKLHEMGAAEIAVSDTIGVANPRQVTDVVARLLDVLPRDAIALHFHDTYGLAIANVCAGLAMGIARYDSAAGGLGGCPYAPGAAGNLATEDLVYLLDALGVKTGIDLGALVDASLWFEKETGITLPSRVLQARRSARGKPSKDQ